MSIYVVTYAYSAHESDLAIRRVEHRDYLAGLDELVVSGPAERGRRAVLVFRAESREDVEELVAADPFVAAGFVGERVVLEWDPILGSLAEHF
ncbi:YciI family protein [Aeromicrobium sp. CF4.19]|uniref:YciI family protein n=1 Tax=Aeromicrobium sp. CF4.19 TaxID=3373082 RepID=UPI003EE81EC7